MVDRLGHPVFNSPNRLTFIDQPIDDEKFTKWLADCPCNWIRLEPLTNGRISYAFFVDEEEEIDSE